MYKNKGKIKALLGPTNTGKTFDAFQEMLTFNSGMMGFPLRLLARENYDRALKELGPAHIALLTGEEKIVPKNARYYFCTTESMPTSLDLEFVAIDEIQLAQDPERGHIFTDRILNCRGSEQTIFIGSDIMQPMLEHLDDDIEFIQKERFSHLTYRGYKKLTRLPPRSAIIAFSVDDVYTIAEIIRRQKGGTAIVLGALSPRTRNAQVALYQKGEVDYLVATDAIGMGLNLDIHHVAFAKMFKYDGKKSRPLERIEISQIAGRAGRFKTDGSFGVTGEAKELNDLTYQSIQNHEFEPATYIYWRNSNLSFRSIKALIRSLEDKPAQNHRLSDYFRRGRPATDYLALKKLEIDPDIQKLKQNPAIVRLLWECCQIPDFKKTMNDDHTNLIKQIFFDRLGDLKDCQGRVREDLIEARLKRINRMDGTIDSLMNRLAAIRVWRYVANQNDWLYNAQKWREKTLKLEDELSDTLHERLAARFVNKESSLLLKRMKLKLEMDAKISENKEIIIGDMTLGKIKGLGFEPYAGTFEEDKKTLIKSVRPVLSAHFEEMINAIQADNTDLEYLKDAMIQWKGESIARLIEGPDLYSPNIILLNKDYLTSEQADRLTTLLKDWMKAIIQDQLGSFLDLEKPDESGLVSGVLFQVFENLGWIERSKVADIMDSLDLEQKGRLKKKGIYLGAFTIYHKAILVRKNQELHSVLWNVANPDNRFSLMDGGHTSYPLKNDAHAVYSSLLGFMPLGKTAVRLDMLERLNSKLYETADKGLVELTNEMVNMIGIDFGRAHKLLFRMGFKVKDKEKRLYRLPSKHVEKTATMPSKAEKNPRHKTHTSKKDRQEKNFAKAKVAAPLNNPFAGLASLKEDLEKDAPKKAEKPQKEEKPQKTEKAEAKTDAPKETPKEVETKSDEPAKQLDLLG